MLKHEIILEIALTILVYSLKRDLSNLQNLKNQTLDI